MRTLIFSYNQNSEKEYLVMPKDNTPGALVNGFEGCVNYILSYLVPVNVEISSVEGDNHITKSQENTLKKVAEIHNKLKNIETILKK